MAYVARFCALCLTAFVTVQLLTGCATTSDTNTIYRVRVQAGDSLASIANQYDTTWQKIAKLNNITRAGQFKVGDVLRVQPGPGGIVASSGDDIHVHASNAPDSPDSNGDEIAGPPRRGLFFGGNQNQANGRIGNSELNWPVYGQLSSHYGRRGRRMHQGIDIKAKHGAPVMSAGNGVVLFTGRQRGYGRVVIIRHQNYKTLYAHLSAVNVRIGATVGPHTEIGKIGTTGNSTGPHLHFEIRKHDDKAVNPLAVLQKERMLSSLVN